MGDLGFPGGVVEATDQAFQIRQIWEVRAPGPQHHDVDEGRGKAHFLHRGLVQPCGSRTSPNIRDRLDAVFAKHSTYGTWYAHASVGMLHVRPVINLKQELGAKKSSGPSPKRRLRSSASTRARIRASMATASVRSEHSTRPVFGSRIVRAFEEVKDAFDPSGLFNPGKIVRAPKMDDRSLFRFTPGYTTETRSVLGARLVGVGRLRGRGRDVQQQRSLPQIRSRRDVSRAIAPPATRST